MHTILGANGAIARELSLALPYAVAASAVNIRQVSRCPRKVNATDITVAANLLNAQATATAVAGSDVAYLVAGLTYDTKTWQANWPRVMRNVVDACQRHGSRLVFLDNVYAYGKVEGVMTEATPFNPISKKGEVRAQIATMLLNEMRAGNISAMIVRSADFYGPGATQSFPHATVFERLKANKTPQWIGNANTIHNFTYTPDIGRAMALLGQSDKAYGQTWHLPTTKEALTGAEFVRQACKLMARPDKLQVAPRWMLKLMGIFNAMLRENDEMMYQFVHDYRFDSSRIEAVFDLQPTTYHGGITASIRSRINART